MFHVHKIIKQKLTLEGIHNIKSLIHLANRVLGLQENLNGLWHIGGGVI